MALHNTSMVNAQLIGIMLECMLYGLFFSFTVAAIYLLMDRRTKSDSVFLVVIIILFLLATAHMIVKMDAAFEAFSPNSSQTPMGYYSDLSTPNEIAQWALVVTQVLVGDSVLIYCLYVVWKRTWYIIIPPTILLIGTGVTGYGAAASITTATTRQKFMETAPPWMIACTLTTFFTNAYGTGLIGFKIYSSLRSATCIRSLRSSCSIARSALIALIESAALYLAAAATFTVLTAINSNVQFVFLYTQPSIVGITFSAIIIRISLGLSNYNVSSAESRQIVSIGGTRRLVTDEVEMSTMTRPLAVRVNQLVEIRRDDTKAVN